MIKWLYEKWVKGGCRHLCFLCEYKNRCEYERHLFNKNKPP